MSSPTPEERLALVISIARDAMVVGGAGLVTAGVSFIYGPAGAIVGGLFLLAAGLIGALRS
jgi:hypothetical protein